MPASPSSVLTLGLGSWGGVNTLPTLGFGVGEAVIEPADTPGGVFRRWGDTGRVFRRAADAGRVFRREGDTGRVFRRSAQ